VNKKQVVAHHTTAGQGAYSKTGVDEVLFRAAQFCRAHPSEVVIFRISHTSAEKTKAHEIAIASGGDTLHTGSGNLAEKTLADIASEGNRVCIFDEEKFGPYIDQSKGIHGFSKYTLGSQGNPRGLSCCGCYSRTHELHDVVSNGLRGHYKHNVDHGHRHKHLWQVYWQKTYVNPVSTTGIEDGTKKDAYYLHQDGTTTVHGGTHAATRHMIRLMQGLGRKQGEDYVVQKKETHREGLLRRKVTDADQVLYSTLDLRNYSLPNIFSYDFVIEATNRRIVRMNEKNLQANQG